MINAQPKPVSDLSKYFAPESSLKETPRLAISLEALDKCGKTHWALHTAPDPILILTNDPGTTHVVNKARRTGKRVEVVEIPFERPDVKVLKASDVDKTEHGEHKKQWAKYRAVKQALIDDRMFRTVVDDTATDFWHLAELSHFGKLRGNARIDIRTELNADFSGLFWDLYRGRPELNMILIHKLRKEYKPKSSGGEDAWTGGYEREGFGKIGFAVDLCLRCGWDGLRKQFYTEVDKGQATRFGGGDLSGTRWYGEESGFGLLGIEVFPDTIETPEWWGL